MRHVILLTALMLGLGISSSAAAEVFTSNYEAIYNPYMEARSRQVLVTDLSEALVAQEYDVAERNFMVMNNPSMQERLYRITNESESAGGTAQGDLFEVNFQRIENPASKWEL